MASRSEEKRDVKEIRLKDISHPKIKKIVHRVMVKYQNNRFFDKRDYVDKIFEKLKINPRPYERISIRRLINIWININKNNDSEDVDSKKGLLPSDNGTNHTESNKTIIDDLKSTCEISKRKSVEIPPPACIVINDVESTHEIPKKSAEIEEKEIEPVPPPICLKCYCPKDIPLIDLTEDDKGKHEVNKTEETLTDSEMHNINAVFNLASELESEDTSSREDVPVMLPQGVPIVPVPCYDYPYYNVQNGIMEYFYQLSPFIFNPYYNGYFHQQYQFNS